MPHITKTSAMRATSFNNLKDILKKYTKSKDIKSQSDSLLGDKGLFTGIAGAIGKKFTTKNFADKAGGQFKKMQEKIVDLDIKAGNKMHQLIRNDKGGKRDKISNVFIDKKQFKVNDKKGKPTQQIEVDVPGISAPLSKLKNVGLPLAGGLYLSSKIYGNDEEGGENKLAQNKEKLIQKIAGQLNHSLDSDTDVEKLDYEEISKIAMAASKILKRAALERREIENKLGALEAENNALRKEAIENDRYLKSEKLAHQMNQKGMIKKADIDSQIKQLIELDETGFGMLKEAVKKMSTNSVPDGVDNLTFLSPESNIYSRDGKKTLADSLEPA